MNLKTSPIAIHPSVLPFRHGCNNLWVTKQNQEAHNLSSELLSWLFDEHSLTQRLCAIATTFEVVVLREGPASISDAELQLFATHEGLNSREVLLLCDGQPQVYARTLIPQTTLEHANSLLKTLGNKSLGEVLFRDKSMQRQAIEITSFSKDSTMADFAQSLSLEVTHPLWARRSIFTLNDNPLMVSEVFLPNSYAYQKEQAE